MKNIKNIAFVTIVVVVMLISSCGQANFDISLNVEDTDPIDLIALTSLLSIQAEIPVSTTGFNFGIDLEKIIYDYVIASTGSDPISIGIKLSLYGEATNDIKIRFIGTSNLPLTTESEPEWLNTNYKNKITITGEDIWGWVSLIEPVNITASAPIDSKTTITERNVINQILKQDKIWIVADITTSKLLGVSNSLTIKDQSLQVVGSKITGYYPGVF